MDKVLALGFSIDGIEKVEEGVRVERDIILTHEMLESTPDVHEVPNAEQYRTTNVVNTGGSRVITVYMEVETSGGGGGGGGGNGNGGGKGKKSTAAAAFPSTYDLALDEAISRYNGENLDLTFQRVTSSTGADIVFSRLGKRDERQGVLGSAGFPTNQGDPYGQIQMSGVLQSSYGLSVDGIATIMAHEMGHCIGFRHTDYFDRSISCGGSAYNEGNGGVGDIHIPGTPTGATLQAQSWMLSCTDGSNRDFNNADKTALSWMYSGNF